MKLVKIQNVEKSVCCGEQKIAYNFAFMYRNYDRTTERIIELMRNSLKRDGFDRFNKEAIIEAFENGFEQYRSGKYSVLTSYEEIGKMFKLGGAK